MLRSLEFDFCDYVFIYVRMHFIISDHWFEGSTTLWLSNTYSLLSTAVCHGSIRKNMINYVYHRCWGPHILSASFFLGAFSPWWFAWGQSQSQRSRWHRWICPVLPIHGRRCGGWVTFFLGQHRCNIDGTSYTFTCFIFSIVRYATFCYNACRRRSYSLWMNMDEW